MELKLTPVQMTTNLQAHSQADAFYDRGINSTVPLKRFLK